MCLSGISNTQLRPAPALEAGRKCDRKALLEAVPGMLQISAYAQEISVWIHTDPRGWRSRARAGADPAPGTQHLHPSTACLSLPSPSSPLLQDHPIRGALPEHEGRLWSWAGSCWAGQDLGSPAVPAPRACVQFTKDSASSC